MVADTTDTIELFRLLTLELFRLLALKGALKLEMKGLKPKGASALKIIKNEFGFPGDRLDVLTQLEQHIGDLHGQLADSSGSSPESYTSDLLDRLVE